MNSGFIVGKNYARTALLEFTGSRQQQSGIIWGDQCAEAIICTSGGRHGAKASYADQPHPDGTWSYFGQGANGDQDPESYANQLLISGQRSVLFFTTRELTSKEARASGNWKKQYTFIGEFCVGSWDTFVPNSGTRQNDRLLRFTLVPINEADSEPLETSPVRKEDVSKLQNELHLSLEQMGTSPRKGVFQAREYFLRSSLLRKYIRLRANGRCEYCEKPAPFVTLAGVPFLEIHHIFRLADDGPDKPTNAVALCPNCHRNAHHGENAEKIKEDLVNIAKCKESAAFAKPAQGASIN